MPEHESLGREIFKNTVASATGGAVGALTTALIGRIGSSGSGGDQTQIQREIADSLSLSGETPNDGAVAGGSLLVVGIIIGATVGLSAYQLLRKKKRQNVTRSHR